jgi:hypothetical protein
VMVLASERGKCGSASSRSIGIDGGDYRLGVREAVRGARSRTYRSGEDAKRV